jgi:hypothetical protein
MSTIKHALICYVAIYAKGLSADFQGVFSCGIALGFAEPYFVYTFLLQLQHFILYQNNSYISKQE